MREIIEKRYLYACDICKQRILKPVHRCVLCKKEICYRHSILLTRRYRKYPDNGYITLMENVGRLCTLCAKKIGIEVKE